MEEITTLGIDLAKRVFALHGVNAAGQIKLRQVCRRDELVGIVARLPACLIGWKRALARTNGRGSSSTSAITVRLMALKVRAALSQDRQERLPRCAKRLVRRWRDPTCALFQ
jgi:hypothetical protein